MGEPVREVRRSDPDSRLLALADLAAAADAPVFAAEARELAKRVVDGRYYVACVGQFKRGKSTLLNALAGVDVLPTGVVPVTSAITLLRHGPELAAEVHYENGTTQQVSPGTLGAFVSEAENPGNAKQVRAVEVFVPNPLFRNGMCLVDTPGLGSVFDASNAVTERFLPHIDAALVVIGADPPISGEELSVVEQVASTVRHLVFVLNKADRVPARDVAESAAFAARVLSERLRRPVGPVLVVSAAERLEQGATRDWPSLESSLAALARDAGADLVRGAEARGFGRIGRSLLRELDERRDALVRPAEESRHRVAQLRRSVAAGEQALTDLGVLLAAEQARLVREFRHRHERFFPTAQETARRELEDEVRRMLDVPRHRLRAAAFEKARLIADGAVEAFRREIEPVGEAMYRATMERFVRLANEFLDRLRASGEAGMDALPSGIEAGIGLRAESRLYYTHILDATESRVGSLLDVLRPTERRLRATLRRVTPYQDRIIEANSSRIANDLVERVTQSREALQRELLAALRQVTGVAERALSLAEERRREGATAVARELEHVESLRREVVNLLEDQPRGETA